MTLGVPASRVAAEIEREAGSWTAIFCEDGQERGVADAMLVAIEDAQAVAEGGTARVLEADGELPETIARMPHNAAAVVIGLERLQARRLSALDLRRNVMIGGASVVLIIPRSLVPLIRAHMPNTWSLVGPRGWWIEMPEDTLDIEQRLASLRKQHGTTDEQVIEQAEARQLPLDPPFVEWLVLLGRGDLLE